MSLDWEDGIDRRMADWLQDHGWPTDVEAHCRTLAGFACAECSRATAHLCTGACRRPVCEACSVTLAPTLLCQGCARELEDSQERGAVDDVAFPPA